MSIAFAISFAAILFKGPLAPLLGQGITLALMGAAVMGVLGSLLFSFRGSICAPQDVTSILLAGAGASIFASFPLLGAQDLLSTIIVLLMVSSIFAGIAAFAFGKLRLGYLARFMPYPVVGGFLAAVGYLLWTSALGMMLNQEVTIYTIWYVVAQSDPMHWVPWMVTALGITLLLRHGSGVFTLPVSLLASIVFFYLALKFGDISPEDAAPLLLGPFEDMNVRDLVRDGFAAPIQWAAIVAQLPAVIAIAGLTILGTLLNSTGLELTLGQDSDFEKDLRAGGISNIAAGMVGGMPGYQLIGETLLAHEFGLRGRLPGLAAAAGCIFALTFGASLLAYIPVGAIAMLIAYLGLDLLLAWLWDERRRLSPRDYGIVALIVLVAAFVGFLEALGVGLFAAMAIFVVSYARLDVVRLRSTAATRRSRVERSDTELAVLSDRGQNVIVLELTGYIFFGTANGLTERIRKELVGTPEPSAIILDFSKLSGFDASAAFALRKMVRTCEGKSVDCVFAGMTAEMEDQYLCATPPDERATLRPTLDIALRDHEDNVLVGFDVDDTLGQSGSMLAFAEKILAREVVPKAVSVLTLRAKDVLVEEGSRSTDIFVLRSGSMRAQVKGPLNAQLVIARFLPGALIGEIAYYAGVARTATLVAEGECTLYRFEPARLAMDDLNLGGELHNLAAAHIARRLVRSTQLIRDAGI